MSSTLESVTCACTCSNMAAIQSTHLMPANTMQLLLHCGTRSSALLQGDDVHRPLHNPEGGCFGSPPSNELSVIPGWSIITVQPQHLPVWSPQPQVQSSHSKRQMQPIPCLAESYESLVDKTFLPLLLPNSCDSRQLHNQKNRCLCSSHLLPQSRLSCDRSCPAQH